MVSVNILEYLEYQPFNVSTLLLAYRTGWFPMGDPDTKEIYWHSPQYRAVFPLQDLDFSKSLKKTVSKGTFSIKFNTAFEQVIKACAHRADTWITEPIIDTYIQLHIQGYAHSVETYVDETLVGGLYGVSIGSAFFGESMFSSLNDASKVAFYGLVQQLRLKNYTLLDSQYLNDFTEQLGAGEIKRSEYLSLLSKALIKECIFLP